MELFKERWKMQRITSKPNFHSFSIFHNNLIAIQLTKQKVVIKQPIYIGFSVLELSKLLMYTFHYRYIVPKYGTKSEAFVHIFCRAFKGSGNEILTKTRNASFEVKSQEYWKIICRNYSKNDTFSNYHCRNCSILIMEEL